MDGYRYLVLVLEHGKKGYLSPVRISYHTALGTTDEV